MVGDRFSLWAGIKRAMIHRSREIERRRLSLSLSPSSQRWISTLDPAAAAVWGNDVRTDIRSLARYRVLRPTSVYTSASASMPLTGFARMISRARTHTTRRKNSGMASRDALITMARYWLEK